jgi:hypothetical protein
MKTIALVFTLVFLVGCSEPSKLRTPAEEEAAYRLKTAPQREAARWQQIEANFALSLKQQNAELENPEPYEPRIYQEFPE